VLVNERGLHDIAVQYNPPTQCFPVQAAFPPLAGNAEYTRITQQIVWLQSKTSKVHSVEQNNERRGPKKKRGVRVGA
jgi:hypothetical protein